MRLPDRPEAGPIDAGASGEGRDKLAERLARLPDGHPSSPRSEPQDLRPDAAQADDLDLDQDGAEPPGPDAADGGPADPWFAADLAGPATPDG